MFAGLFDISLTMCYPKQQQQQHHSQERIQFSPPTHSNRVISVYIYIYIYVYMYIYIYIYIHMNRHPISYVQDGNIPINGRLGMGWGGVSLLWLSAHIGCRILDIYSIHKQIHVSIPGKWQHMNFEHRFFPKMVIVFIENYFNSACIRTIQLQSRITSNI